MIRNNIPRRLSQLERKADVHAPQPLIFVTFGGPGHPCESSRAECDDQVWERRPGETEEAFQRRVPFFY